MKKVIVTPAGRERYLQTLVKYIKREVGTFDEWHLWLNTNIQSDIDYCRQLEQTYSWIKVITIPTVNEVLLTNIYKFFKYAQDIDSVYIRLDDDIVYLEPGFFDKLFKKRLENPEPFLVYPNIINNAIISHIHQRNNLFNCEKIGYGCMDKNGWENPSVAETIHRSFINDVKTNNIDKWKKSFNVWDLYDYERVSINCISWFGSEFAKFNGEVGTDEEDWLSTKKPSFIKKPNIIVNEPICVHFSFFTQRKHLDSTDILNQYDSLSN